MNKKHKKDSKLLVQVKGALKEVIDPETKLDVWSMKLVKDLKVDEQKGKVDLTFKPASPYCPLAYTLGLDIKKKIKEIEGVDYVNIEVEGFAHSQHLKEILSAE